MPTPIKLALPAALAAGLTLTACGLAEPLAAPTVAPAPPASTSEPARPPAPKQSRCLAVPAALAKFIASEAVAGSGFEPVKAAAVKSGDHANVHMVAVKFKVSGVSGTQVGVWATGGALDGRPSTVFAVDGTAREFTTWHANGAVATLVDDGVDAAKECVK